MFARESLYRTSRNKLFGQRCFPSRSTRSKMYGGENFFVDAKKKGEGNVTLELGGKKIF